METQQTFQTNYSIIVSEKSSFRLQWELITKSSGRISCSWFLFLREIDNNNLPVI